MVHVMSRVEKLILEEIFPAGSRVELECMGAGREEGLKTGDREQLLLSAMMGESVLRGIVEAAGRLFIEKMYVSA
nr:hypothetical protein [uncultured Schaedlerella sp.]